MVIAGIILLILGALGFLRWITLPAGIVLLVVGIIWDAFAVIGHAIFAVF